MVAAGCGSSNSSGGGSGGGTGAASGPYVIGMSNDLSGPISALGLQGLAGLNTYID
jgi:hypothetical protein